MRIKGWTNYMKSVVSLIESPFEGGISLNIQKISYDIIQPLIRINNLAQNSMNHESTRFR